MSITPETTAPGGAAAPAGRPQTDIRRGVAGVLLAAALVPLLVAVTLAAKPQLIAGEEIESRMEGLRHKEVWPVVAWCALVGVAGLVGAGWFYRRPAAEDTPRGLSRPLAITLLVFAVLMLGVPGYLAVRADRVTDAIGPVFLWGGLLSAVGLAGGVALLVQEDAYAADEVRFRLTVGIVGGLLGLVCTLLGFALPLLVYRETLLGGLTAWQTNWQAIVLSALPLVGGLALMFVSLQAGRRVERQSQNVRRLIYGYNTVLTSLLLVAVLALPNVLAYAYPFTKVLDRPFEWTKNEFFALDQRTRNVLQSLGTPVKVYLILPRNTYAMLNSQRMLDYSRSVTGKLSWELVDPRDPANKSRLEELRKQYSLPDETGMLVVAENSTSGKTHEFVPDSQLFEQQSDPQHPQRPPLLAYKGENALLNALISLTENKMVVYFTRGHGELTTEPDLKARPPMGRQASDPNGLSRLAQALKDRRSVDVRTLDFKGDVKKVPDDATVVVVAGPDGQFTADEAKALREYSERREVKKDGKISVTAGRLLLMLPPLAKRGGGKPTLATTGLEDLLTANNVKLGSVVLKPMIVRTDRGLLNMGPSPEVEALPDRKSANPIVTAFQQPGTGDFTVFDLSPARRVEPIDPVSPNTTVDCLLRANPNELPWEDVTLEGRFPGASKIDRESPPCLAVAVSSSSAPSRAPDDAAHAGMRQKSPRMVVFGSVQWVTNRDLAGGKNDQNIDLFVNCLSWLAESSAIGTSVEPRVRPVYNLNVPATEVGRLSWLPLGLLLLTVTGMGLGVWVVRRR